MVSLITSINFFVDKCLNTHKYFFDLALIGAKHLCAYLVTHPSHVINQQWALYKLEFYFSPLTAVTIFSPAIEEESYQQISQSLVQMKSKMLLALTLRYVQNQRVASVNPTSRCYHFCNFLVVPKQRPILLYLKKPQSYIVARLVVHMYTMHAPSIPYPLVVSL